MDLFQPKPNVLSHPEGKITLLPSEVGFDKYETKEERVKREAIEKTEEERMRALLSDDSGLRALKDMMGGTLEEKKTQKLTENIQREEWMDKTPDQMTDEEKMRLKEFEVKETRLKEEQEKIRKNLQSQLKKEKQEIQDFIEKFEEKLNFVFKRKLEYDQRIFEQQLYIVRLALSILTQQEARTKLHDLAVQIEEID